MLNIARTDQPIRIWSGSELYEGPLVEWTPEQDVAPRAASVGGETSYIIMHAERNAACMIHRDRHGSKLLKYAVKIGAGGANLHSKDALEWRVRHAMLRAYKGRDVVIGIGSPQRIWATAQGKLLGADLYHATMEAMFVRRVTNNQPILIAKGDPLTISIDLRKIQSITSITQPEK